MSHASKRGRPTGSSWLNKDDYAVLERIADRMILDPTLKPTTAMRAIGIERETDHRRLREKWNGKAESYMAAARARRHAAQIAAFENMCRQLATVGLQVAAVVDHLATRAAIGLQRWADENPETVNGMLALGQRWKALQIEARPDPSSAK